MTDRPAIARSRARRHRHRDDGPRHRPDRGGGGGSAVKLYDTRDGAAAEASAFVARMLRRAAEKGGMTEGAAEAAIGRLAIVEGLDAMAGADIVVEAIVEDIEAKKRLFAELEAIVPEDCVLASNTSSLSVTAIAADCARPERVAGYHFFNPVPLLKVVEVVDGLLTAPWVGDVLDAVARRCGHRPVRAEDSPGFLVNHAGRGLNTEGLRIVQEGIARPQDVDDILREGGTRFRMGPFELMDTTGLDVSGVVMESIYRQFYEEPRFRPVPIARQRMAAGLYGRKTGRGFYVYEDGRKAAAEAARHSRSGARPGLGESGGPRRSGRRHGGDCGRGGKWKAVRALTRRRSASSRRRERMRPRPRSTRAFRRSARWRSTPHSGSKAGGPS